MNKIFERIILKLARKNIIHISDKEYFKLMGKIKLNKTMDLDNPKTFNEKLQWIKLYDRKPEYTEMVDKYKVKEYVAKTIGAEYIIPTIGIYDRVEDIDFETLPDKFVMKTTHDSGSIIICKDKNKLDKTLVKEKMNKSLKRNYYSLYREWPYKNVKPRIIIENMIGKENEEIEDYKFFCFNGKVGIILVCSERSKRLKETWFDINWNLLELREGNHEIDDTIKKPINLELMIKLSEILSENIAFIRVDFYEVNGKVYFGELTFFPNAGYEEFKPEEYNQKLGDMIDLSKIK